LINSASVFFGAITPASALERSDLAGTPALPCPNGRDDTKSCGARSARLEQTQSLFFRAYSAAPTLLDGIPRDSWRQYSHFDMSVAEGPPGSWRTIQSTRSASDCDMLISSGAEPGAATMRVTFPQPRPKTADSSAKGTTTGGSPATSTFVRAEEITAI
jgi:hypothetical protein